jgi:hypothetical protein
MQEPPPQPQAPQQPPPPPAPQPLQPAAIAGFTPQTNTLAIVSLVSGIVSWFAVPIVGGIVAVVTGHMAKGQIRRTGEQGDTFATVGLVLGYIHLAVVLLVAGLLLLLLVGTFAAIRTTTSG